MRLKELLSGIYENQINESFCNYEILSLSCDSRLVQKQSLFVALPGAKFDGNDFIAVAIERGALVVVCANSANDIKVPSHVCLIRVLDPRKFLCELARRFYADPSRTVKVFGVTGTNGKTTFTYLMESIAHQYQKKCAVVGTINYRIGTQILPSKNTTPSFLENQQFLSQLSVGEVDYSFMEVSSHALVQGRVDLIRFRVAVFTNLTGDHLDYHKTMEEYFRAKSILFRDLDRDAVAVINADDPYGQKLMEMTEARVFTYGMSASARIKATEIHFGFSGSTMTIVTPSGNFELTTPLIGMHNVYNILAAVGASLADGIPLEIIKDGLQRIAMIPGRLERVEPQLDYYVFIDYAHTEDGLKNVLHALRATGKARIITLFGCGGDRDRSKRPKMGNVSCELSDYSIITTDNPRSEDPLCIIQEIEKGFSKRNYEIIPDRTQAIHKALSLARPGDVVLIAGKGHETYQIFKDQTIDYDERQVIRDFLKG